MTISPDTDNGNTSPVDVIQNQESTHDENLSDCAFIIEDTPPVDPFQRSRHSLIRSPAVRSPISGSLFAVMMLILSPVLIIGILLIPWQQSAIGVGTVTSFDPANRPQKIESPVEGQIAKWLASEGMLVQKGDVLVQLQDNDPDRLNRLNDGATLGLQQIDSVKSKRDRYQEKYSGQQDALIEKINETQNKIQSLKNKRIGILAELNTEQAQLERYQELLSSGIVSQRDFELAQLKRDKAQSSYDAIQAQIKGMQNQLAGIKQEGRAKLAEIEGELNDIDGKIAAIEQKQLDIQSKVAKQSTQQVLAPNDGVIFKIEGGLSGEQIKKGDALMQFVPTSDDRAIEMEVDGNDIALIEVGQEVRLIFEGWPALQFVGFPGADAGTYAGQVKVIDATSSYKGKFRILVEPHPDEHPWPESSRLRQGLRVKGWVMLGTVPLGYEIWRRINGFPALPTIEKGQKINVPLNKKPKKSSLEGP